jgi:hypothetical protein
MFYGQDSQLLKLKRDKITSTTMQKMFGEHRKRYRDRVRAVLKLPRANSIKKGVKGMADPRNKNGKFSAGDNLFAAIVRYTDGSESLCS